MPGRILLVEDSGANRLILRSRLNQEYYDVVEAEDGIQRDLLVHVLAHFPSIHTFEQPQITSLFFVFVHKALQECLRFQVKLLT